jgi:hypothetical protein
VVGFLLSGCVRSHVAWERQPCIPGDSQWSLVEASSHPLPGRVSLHALSAAALGEDVIFAGTLFPIDAEIQWDGQPPVVGRLDVGLIPGPPMSRWATYPRVVPFGTSNVAVVWGEPSDTAGLVPDVFGHTPTSLLYSVWSRSASWSKPIEILRDSAGIIWQHVFGALAPTRTGEVHLAFSSRRQWPGLIHHAVLSDGAPPQVEEIPLYQASAYTTLLVSGDTVLLGVNGLGSDTVSASATHLFRSLDGGRSWSLAQVLGGTEHHSLTTLNLARAADGTLHLLRGLASPPGSAWTVAFQHSTSSDDGRTWRLWETFDSPDAQHPQVMVDSCGVLHMTVSETDPPLSRLVYRRWVSGKWDRQEQLFRELRPVYPVLLQGKSGPEFIAQAAVGQGVTSLMRARVRPE